MALIPSARISGAAQASNVDAYAPDAVGSPAFGLPGLMQV